MKPQEVERLWSEAIKTGFVENRPEVQVFAELLETTIKLENTCANESNRLSRLIKEAELQAELHPSKDARFFAKSVLAQLMPGEGIEDGVRRISEIIGAGEDE